MSLLSKLNFSDKNQTDSSKNAENKRLSRDFINIFIFFYVFGILGLFTILWHAGFTNNSATPILWALASITFGAIFGFLFGVPKILQGNRPLDNSNEKSNSDYRQQVNTNLTEISDWLTKIIVGLGLINLKDIPSYFNRAAQVLSSSMDLSAPSKNLAFALAVVICFLILGFLFGYLSTRLFLQGAFSRADQEASTAIESRVESAEAQITSLQTQQDLLSPAKLSNAEAQSPGNIGVITTSKLTEVHAITELRKLADNYLNIRVADKYERLSQKNQSAKKMFDYAIKYGITKDKILEVADQTANEALILTLANIILAFPDKGDVANLLRVASQVTRWHIQYRIVQAFGELFSKGYALTEDYESVNNVLKRYEKTGDQSLINQIKGTRTLIERIIKPTPES